MKQQEEEEVIIAIDITSIIEAQQKILVEQDQKVIIQVEISELNKAAQNILIEKYQEQGLAKAFVTRGETSRIADHTPDGLDSDEQSDNIKFEASRELDLESEHFDQSQKANIIDKDKILDNLGLDENAKKELVRIAKAARDHIQLNRETPEKRGKTPIERKERGL